MVLPWPMMLVEASSVIVILGLSLVMDGDWLGVKDLGEVPHGLPLGAREKAAQA